MADTNKTPANPDTQLNLDDLFKKLTGQAEAIGKALDGVSLSKKDADGKDTKPPTDTCGLARMTAQALRSKFKTQMKEYTGSSVRRTVADDISDKMTRIRKHAQDAAALAREVAEDLKDADAALAAQAKIFAETNAPKLEARIIREEDRAKKAQERADKLKKARAAAGIKRAG